LTEQEREKYRLKLEKSLVETKHARRVYYLHLKDNLIKLGFKPSEHDECIFYHGIAIFIVYTDDTILLRPKQDRDRQPDKAVSTNFQD
jgi:hypothetical protein